MTTVLAPHSRIYVAGADTSLGAALIDRLTRDGYTGVAADRESPDPRDAAALRTFLCRFRPELVFVAAGKAGGIGENQRAPADLMLDNLRIAVNVIGAAHEHGVTKLLYVASSCTYPKDSPQPMRPDMLVCGALEPTSEYYALAKLAGLKLCEAFRRQHRARFVTCIPSNPFGPRDDFDPETAHVIGALIHRLHEATCEGRPSVTLWGSGAPQRDFIFANDLADACIFLMQRYEDGEPINVGSGVGVSIRELAEMVQDVVGFRGRLRFDATQPDGVARKILDSTALERLGWHPSTSLRAGLEATYADYVTRVARRRRSGQATRAEAVAS